MAWKATTWTLVLLAAQLGAGSAMPPDGAKGTHTRCHLGPHNWKVSNRAPEATAPPSWPVFTWAGQAYTGAAPSGWFTIDSQTLRPGGHIKVDGTHLRLPKDQKTLVVRDHGHESAIPVTAGQPDQQQHKKAAQPTGEPEGKPHPDHPDHTGTKGHHKDDQTDDGSECGGAATASDSGSVQQQAETTPAPASPTAAATQSDLGGIQITSNAAFTQDQSTPTTAPASSSPNAAGLPTAAPWLGAAVAGVAWALV